MKNLERLSLAEMKAFVMANRQVGWSAVEGAAVYGLIERVLKVQQYRRLKKGQKGIVRSFLGKVTALSRAQLTRLIQRWMETRHIERKPAQRPNFPRRYTAADIATLAEVDAAHEDLSGPAVRHLCRRGWEVFADQRFQRLAGISASHIYNLRKSGTYRKIRVRVQHTQARPVSIGERRQPDPKGQAGYLRVDTVHQGQYDGQPGVYHINAVDTVTQWQVVGCAETISELHLIPVLEAMLHQFPFRSGPPAHSLTANLYAGATSLWLYPCFKSFRAAKCLCSKALKWRFTPRRLPMLSMTILAPGRLRYIMRDSVGRWRTESKLMAPKKGVSCI